MIRLMKNELCERIMKEFVALRPKINSYLVRQKAKDTKKSIIKCKTSLKTTKSVWRRMT